MCNFARDLVNPNFGSVRKNSGKIEWNRAGSGDIGWDRVISSGIGWDRVISGNIGRDRVISVNIGWYRTISIVFGILILFQITSVDILFMCNLIFNFEVNSFINRSKVVVYFFFVYFLCIKKCRCSFDQNNFKKWWR